MRVVIDTNVWISAALFPSSIPCQCVEHAAQEQTILINDVLFQELSRTLFQDKLKSYLSDEKRKKFLQYVEENCEPVAVIETIRACRDKKDNMILEIAVNGEAQAIITGDKDLLALHPFRGIDILSPKDFLARPGQNK